MSSHSASHLAAVLCAMASRGKIRLPLSHSHALECVACFAGHREWNELAGMPGAEQAKIRARALREAVNARLVDGVLDLQKAEEAIAQASGEWAGSNAAPGLNHQKTSALPITFLRHPLGDWLAENPNALVDGEEVDALISRPNTEDTRQQLESLFASHPGDIDVCHTLASRLLEHGQLSAALVIWRHAWSLIQPGLDKVLREDPAASVSYSSVRNRPILRALHGLAICIGRHRDEPSQAEHEKLVRMGYALMRDRDAFGLRTTLARLLAERGEWKDVMELFTRDDPTTFNERAIVILALHHLGEKKRLAQAQRSLIKDNAFAAEVLFRGRAVEDYNGTVTLGTWQEGAEHTGLFADLWRANDARKIWRSYRTRIKSTQTARLTQYWATRTVVGRDRRYLGALVEGLGGLHDLSMPLVRNERPLVASFIPDGCVPSDFAIDEPEIRALSIPTFEGWLAKGYGLGSTQRGLIFEWLVWRMIEDGTRRLVVKSGALHFDGRPATSVSRELQDNLWDIIAWELDGQLLDRPLLVRAPTATQSFECRFSGKWTHEDAGIELAPAA